MVVAEGTAPCSSSKSFGPTSTLNMVTPVTLPPGRFQAGRQARSAPDRAIVVKTTGIVAGLPLLAARAAGVLHRCDHGHLFGGTRSAAIDDSRSY